MSAPFSSPFIYYFIPASSEQRWALSEALADKQKLLLKFLLRCFPPGFAESAFDLHEKALLRRKKKKEKSEICFSNSTSLSSLSRVLSLQQAWMLFVPGCPVCSAPNIPSQSFEKQSKGCRQGLGTY